MPSLLPTRISNRLASWRRNDPLQTLQEDFDDLLNRLAADFDAEWMMRPFAPAADVSETESAVQVWLDVPGIDPKDIVVQVSGETLTISGERMEEREEKGKTWYRTERRVGAFSRTLSLPCAVRDEKAKAEYKDGVLTITLPKAEEAKPHRIKVEVNTK